MTSHLKLCDDPQGESPERSFILFLPPHTLSQVATAHLRSSDTTERSSSSLIAPRV